MGVMKSFIEILALLCSGVILILDFMECFGSRSWVTFMRVIFWNILILLSLNNSSINNCWSHAYYNKINNNKNRGVGIVPTVHPHVAITPGKT